MSKMESVLAVRLAVDPSDAHVKASLLELSYKSQQYISLRAGHDPLRVHVSAGKGVPAFTVHIAPLTLFGAKLSAPCLPG